MIHRPTAVVLKHFALDFLADSILPGGVSGKMSRAVLLSASAIVARRHRSFLRWSPAGNGTGPVLSLVRHSAEVSVCSACCCYHCDPHIYLWHIIVQLFVAIVSGILHLSCLEPRVTFCLDNAITVPSSRFRTSQFNITRSMYVSTYKLRARHSPTKCVLASQINRQLRAWNAYGVVTLCVLAQSGSQWTLGLPALLTGTALACLQAEMRKYNSTSWMLPDGTTIKATLDLHRAEPSHIEGVTEGDKGDQHSEGAAVVLFYRVLL